MSPQTLLDFMRLHRLAVEASVSVAGVPQGAIVGFAVSDRFEIVFDTLQTTRKAQNLRQNPHIALVARKAGSRTTSAPFSTRVRPMSPQGRNSTGSSRSTTRPTRMVLAAPVGLA